MGGENLSLYAPYRALFRHWSPSREDTTRTVSHDLGDSALSTRPRPVLDLASTQPWPTAGQQGRKADVVQDSESFHRLVLYVTMVSRDGRPLPGHVAIATSTGIDKTSPQRHPRCPCLLLPYKRAGRGSTTGGGQRTENDERWTTNNEQRKTSLHPTKEDQHLKQSSLYSHFSFETWARFYLTQLVTPTQTLRCKEIQYSLLPAGRRAFFCPNQDKTPCILLASPSRFGTCSIWFTRWLRTPTGPNADKNLETALHLFFECPYARKVWGLVTEWSGSHKLHPRNWKDQSEM
jgi:hypothetical protein